MFFPRYKFSIIWYTPNLFQWFRKVKSRGGGGKKVLCAVSYFFPFHFYFPTLPFTISLIFSSISSLFFASIFPVCQQKNSQSKMYGWHSAPSRLLRHCYEFKRKKQRSVMVPVMLLNRKVIPNVVSAQKLFAMKFHDMNLQ